jgi:phosphoserine phosphatase
MPLKIIFFDCDGTLTSVKSSWEYLHRRLGLWDNNADEFQRLFREGRIDYYQFCKRDALLWKGLSLQRVMAVIDEIPYHEGVKELTGWLRREGIVSVILSTGLSFLVDRVKEELGISRAISNDLLVRKGRLTGEIKIHVEHDNKGYWVRRILNELGLTSEDAAAIGDGEGDRGMFESVGLSIGYTPHPLVLPFVNHVIYNGSLASVADILTQHRQREAIAD